MKIDGKSLNITAEKILKIREILPEAFAEEKIDWEKLKAALGENINFSNERYVLNWAGKSEAFRVLQSQTFKTLIPAKDESVNFDETGHIFIEGENLEVLKILQKSYFNKIKMIYIDPPYNTGNDSFIYPDKFAENKEEYLHRIGARDENGCFINEGLFRKNSKESGQFHSNWLNMMYPRLFLARSLLRDDGVIFVSIDDNEVHNLRLIMNEIFGEENLLSELVWNLKTGTQAGHFTRSHEYILCFAKDKERLKYFTDKSGGVIRHGALKVISKDNPASDITFPKGIEFEGKDAVFEGEIGGTEKQIIHGKMIFKNGLLAEEVKITAGWAMRNQILSWLAGKETLDSKGQKVTKFYFNTSGILWYEKERGTIHPKTVLDDIVGNTKAGTDAIIDIFGYKFFDFPKPTSLLKYLVKNICEIDSYDFIVDFFAGSATTAHAVLDLNKEDGGNRKFICVQLPEPCDIQSEAYKAGYKTIADIAKERIRRVIEKMKQADSSKLEFEKNGHDVGFKVFKLSDSNFKQWQSNIASTEDLEKQMEVFVDPISKTAVYENMVYELLLKSGKDLNSKIEHKDGYFLINGSEIVMLFETVEQTMMDNIIALNPVKVIALDKLFEGNDQLKTSSCLQMKDAKIDFETI